MDSFKEQVQVLMDVTEVKEFQKQVPMMTVAFIVVIAVIGFFLGYVVAQAQGSDEQLHTLHDFAIDEVGGLRSDWERQNKVEYERFEKLEERIKKLETKHEK